MVDGTLVPARALLLGRVLVTDGIEDASHQPKGAGSSRVDGILQTADSDERNGDDPVLDIVGVGTLGAVEAVLFDARGGLVGAGIGVGIGDVGPLARLSDLETVPGRHQPGGGDDGKDVPGICQSRPWWGAGRSSSRTETHL